MKPNREVIRLDLVDAGDRAGPFDVRVRRAMKCLLRGFGLRCVNATSSESGPVTDEPPRNDPVEVSER